ncbi:hypothetical protein BKA59DRAFT_559959 [Fusarium tricinctum]|uniref:Uncharacterized protein n=1 Tax=Fusarium tricinctum TaxID=61284 RepID=A0A8K0RJY5_9HYPO|nr:hypothetical protein BKA59DRAFT_559959 [Fusarium tricinctum]
MKTLLSFTPLLLFPTIVLSACKSFENTVNLKTIPQPEQVSRVIDCTRENSKQDEDGKRYCDVDVYKMGIRVRTNTDRKLSEPLPVFEHVRDSQCGKSGLCDFNETIIIPFTLNETNSRVPENSTGYFAFTPDWICVRGAIKDCNGDDEHREGYRVRICGYRILTRGKNETDPSDDIYAGTTIFVNATDKEIEELGDKRPWPSYKDAMEQYEEESEALEIATYGVFSYFVWSAVTVLFLSL